MKNEDFSGGPVVKTLPSIAGGVSSIPGQGAKISAKKPKYKMEAILWQIQ